MCSATAALVVALRTRDQKTKELGFSSSITAYMGITEPALYGINLPKRYPLIAAMIGGAFGGLYAGLTHTHRFATGSSGLPAVLLYIGDNTLRYLINILIAMVIGVVITAVLTYLLSLKYEINDKKKVQLATEPQVVYAEISSPVKGELLPLSQSDDEAFASQAMGKGFVVKPSEGKVYAPVDGKVVSLFSTKHAIGILGDNGAEILIHIGIDTVDLKGKYFTAHVKQGQKVTKGQLLIEFDRSKITASGYNDEVMVIITNTNSYQNVELLDSATVTDLNKPILQLMA